MNTKEYIRFENSLMILKPDYLHKRRPVLLKLLAEGFQIQAYRKLNFSPETAAEFYEDYSDDKDFMLNVILLSKGISEAFILAKEKGVQELINVMICYFGSASAMETNMHVTRRANRVAKEISFIFPNYIHEPTQMFDRNQFCNKPMLKPLLSEIYDILQNVDCSQENWKVKLADYLSRSNPALPLVTNQCNIRPELKIESKAQQTEMTFLTADQAAKTKDYKSNGSSASTLTSTSPHSSMLLSSSSCLSCGAFERTEPCFEELDLNKRVEPQVDEKVCEDEEILWQEVIVYEEVIPEEESERKLLFEAGEEGLEDIASATGVESDRSECLTPPQKDGSVGSAEPERDAVPESAPEAAEEEASAVQAPVEPAPDVVAPAPDAVESNPEATELVTPAAAEDAPFELDD